MSVGIDNDTAQFAVSSIQRWWEQLGSQRYPDATTLTITADCGGSNGNRTRLWKTELQAFADKTGLAICVCHFPPGTSKWNKIEHRLFSFISMNWRAKPLISRQVVIDLIAATTTRTGLEVYAHLDENAYPKGIEVTDRQLATVNLHGDKFHPEWNYSSNHHVDEARALTSRWPARRPGIRGSDPCRRHTERDCASSGLRKRQVSSGGLNEVVPLAVELVELQVDGGQLGI